MQFFSYFMILTNSCYLIFSSCNHTHGDRLHAVASTLSTSFFNHGLQNRSKRRSFWSRQLPANVETVTVTLTVTNTIFQLPPSSATADGSDLTNLPGTNSVLETSVPPEFVTATDADVPTTSTPTTSSSAFIITFSTSVPSTTELNPQSTVSSTLTGPTPTPILVPSDNSPALPTSTSGLRSSSVASNPSNSNSTDAGAIEPAGSTNPDSEDSNRFLIPLIIVSIICALGLIISCLICRSRRLREWGFGYQHERKTDSVMVHDYRLHARMFEPNPSGGLNYHRSLSRKKRRKLPLIEPTPELGMKDPKEEAMDSRELRLPQSSPSLSLARAS